MKERWSEYLEDFVPKWRHTPGWERFNEWRTPDPAEGYRRLAIDSGFTVIQSKGVFFCYHLGLVIHACCQGVLWAGWDAS